MSTVTAAPFVSQRHPAVLPFAAADRQSIQLELLAILASPFFRSSRRSCDFLRYVVEATLDGKSSSLKERAIGIEVLGRDACYDTGSDAAVRVRANDVRKRLASYYEQNGPKHGYRIELPAGSYVPRFVSTEELIDRTRREFRPETPVFPALELRYLAAPTVLALFICAISIRCQVLGASPFHLFWNEWLKKKSQMAIIVDSGTTHDAVKIDQIQASVPLLNLAGGFQVHPVIQNANKHFEPAHGTVVVRLGDVSGNASGGHLLVERTSRGLYVIDKRSGDAWNHAVLITIIPGSIPTIGISGTDFDALRSGIRVLTDRTTFPQILVKSVRSAQPTQLIFDEQGQQIIPSTTGGRKVSGSGA